MPSKAGTARRPTDARPSVPGARTTTLDEWLVVIDRVLRPVRPDLERCLREGALHRETRRAVARERDAALADCAARIESARAAVLAANDGHVPRLMTHLEREWLTLSHSDPDGVWMDFWARVAPPSWHDRKPWRDAAAATQLDLLVALASDVEGVLAAERAVERLRAALAAWGPPIGARIRWKAATRETDGVTRLLERLRVAADAALAHPRGTSIAHGRAEATKRTVEDAAASRWPDRPLLAAGLAHASFVDALVNAAASPGRPNPIPPLRALWRTGYALVEADEEGVTLEVPPP